eukprot:TRINITY_DN2602_c0_g1_i1.p1 TRINITY_DN2602_c0_g1~~TRINITY_DN2602_c0_g1_i1.p1  ORF type:complete len:484 (-),score=125.02 TRINITY_DN2602_c0_g1_i1:70-1521(-)
MDIDAILKDLIRDVLTFSNQTKDYCSDQAGTDSILDSTRAIARYSLHLRNAVEIFKNHNDFSSLVQIVQELHPLVIKTSGEVVVLLDRTCDDESQRARRQEWISGMRDNVVASLTEIIGFVKRNKDQPKPSGQGVRVIRSANGNYGNVPRPVEEVTLIPINVGTSNFNDSLHELHEIPSDANLNYYRGGAEDNQSARRELERLVEQEKKAEEKRLQAERDAAQAEREQKIQREQKALKEQKEREEELRRTKESEAKLKEQQEAENEKEKAASAVKTPPWKKTAKEPEPSSQSLSPSASKKINQIAENISINMDTFKAGYVHPKFQTKAVIQRGVLEPTMLLVERMNSLEEKKSDMLQKMTKEMELESAKAVTFKELLIKLANVEADGLMSVKQTKMQIAEWKASKEIAALKEDYKLASKFKEDIDRGEEAIQKLNDLTSQLENQIDQLQLQLESSSAADKDWLRDKLLWRTVLHGWLQKECSA